MKSHTRTNTFYDHFGQNKTTKLGNWLVAGVAKRVFEFAQVKQGDRVLEIGPGRGVFADTCLKNGVDYVAIEPNQKMAAALEQRGIRVMQDIVPPLPPMDRTFDAVVMMNVLEHMDTMAAALRLTQEIYEILNPGGKLVIYSPDYVSFQYLFFLNDFSHNYITTWQRLEALLVSAGFAKSRARYENALFKGTLCLLTSMVACWMPFGRLYAMFPNNRILQKLYRLQALFLRRVLMVAEKRI